VNDIKLPPMPSLAQSYTWTDDLEAWARQAVELDRQSRIEPEGRKPTDEDLGALFSMWGWKTKDGRELKFSHFKEMTEILLRRYTAPADTISPKPAEEGDFNTGDSDLDTLLAMTFDMGQGIQGNHDIGMLYADSLEAVQAKLQGISSARDAALDKARAAIRDLIASVEKQMRKASPAQRQLLAEQMHGLDQAQRQLAVIRSGREL